MLVRQKITIDIVAPDDSEFVKDHGEQAAQAALNKACEQGAIGWREWQFRRISLPRKEKEQWEQNAAEVEEKSGLPKSP